MPVPTRWIDTQGTPVNTGKMVVGGLDHVLDRFQVEVDGLDQDEIRGKIQIRYEVHEADGQGSFTVRTSQGVDEELIARVIRLYHYKSAPLTVRHVERVCVRWRKRADERHKQH